MKNRLSVITMLLVLSLFLFSTEIVMSQASDAAVLQEATKTPSEITSKADMLFPTVVFQGAELEAVLQFFAKTGEVNFVVDPGVTGTVNLNLREVTWGTALTSILNTFELVITQEGNTYRVQLVQDYRQKFVDEISYQETQKNLLPLVLRIIQLKYTDASTMSGIISKALSPRAKMVIDDRTNSLIINDINESFREVDSLITALDVEPMQVRITTKIVQIDKDFMEEFGVAWDISGGPRIMPEDGRQVGYPYPDGASYQRTDLTQPDDQYLHTGVFLPGAATQMGRFRWGIITGDYDLGVEISAQEADGRVKVIDGQEIVVLNNEQASIGSSQEIQVCHLDEAGNTVCEFVAANINLNVQPQITGDGRIIMPVDISRDSWTAGGGRESKHANTKVIIDNSQTLAIGAMTLQNVTESEKGVPVLRHIPLLGRLFNYNTKTEREYEIVLFITPEIISTIADDYGGVIYELHE